MGIEVVLKLSRAKDTAFLSIHHSISQIISKFVRKSKGSVYEVPHRNTEL